MRPPKSPAASPAEGKIHGVAAAEAVFRRRPDDIVRAYFTEAAAKRFGPLMRHLAGARRAYHIVEEAELERVAEASHHGGVCLVVRRRRALSLPELLVSLEVTDNVCLVVLEDVGNPHNLGAVMRTAAHFGARALLVSDAAVLQSGAAARVAEGAAEAVEIVEYGALSEALARLRKAGFGALATSSHHGRSVFDTALPGRCVLLLGAEQEGLSKKAFQAADLVVGIPGSGAVESLNVGVAAGVLLGEWWRQRGPRPRPAHARGRRRA
jgi:TrmH RNA methyltransferase